MHFVRVLVRRLLIASLFIAPLLAFAEQPQELEPPIAAKKPHEVTMHGEKRVDNYFWLRDKTNPEVLAHLEAENAYTQAVMRGSEALQQKLYDELLSHIKETDLSLPLKRGDFYYYTRTEAGKQYPIRARRKGSMDAPEEVLLDLNVLAQGLDYIDLGDFTLSDDGNLLAYSTDVKGNSEYTLRIKDLRTGELLPDKIELVEDVVWAGDKTLLYVMRDKVTHRRDRLFRHVLGNTNDELLLNEPDVLFQLQLSRTRDKAFVLVESISKTT
jgi:oligopeptidase B